jgi:hypothetical protein
MSAPQAIWASGDDGLGHRAKSTYYHRACGWPNTRWQRPTFRPRFAIKYVDARHFFPSTAGLPSISEPIARPGALHAVLLGAYPANQSSWNGALHDSGRRSDVVAAVRLACPNISLCNTSESFPCLSFGGYLTTSVRLHSISPSPPSSHYHSSIELRER